MALCENFDFQNKGFFFMHIWVARYEFSESVNKSRVQIIELEMNGGINYEKAYHMFIKYCGHNSNSFF